jgi:hypothetical protein
MCYVRSLASTRFAQKDARLFGRWQALLLYLLYLLSSKHAMPQHALAQALLLYVLSSLKQTGAAALLAFSKAGVRAFLTACVFSRAFLFPFFYCQCALTTLSV